MRGQHARAHLHALGPEREGGRHRDAVGDAAGGDEGHVELVGQEGQQYRRRNLALALESGAFDALDDETVDAGIDRFLRRVERGDDVEDLDPGGLEDRRVRHGRTRRRRDEGDAHLDEHVGDGRVLDVGDRQVHAERSVGHVPHPLDVLAGDVDAHRAGNEADAARPDHRGHEVGLRHETHRRVGDRNVDAEEPRDAVVEARDGRHPQAANGRFRYPRTVLV